MKKKTKKTVNWKRFLAILFAIILVLQTVPVKSAFSVAADAAQAEDMSRNGSTEGKIEETQSADSDSHKEEEAGAKQGNPEKNDQENNNQETKPSANEEESEQDSSTEETASSSTSTETTSENKSGQNENETSSSASSNQNAGENSSTSAGNGDNSSASTTDQAAQPGQNDDQSETKGTSGAGQSGTAGETTTGQPAGDNSRNNNGETTGQNNSGSGSSGTTEQNNSGSGNSGTSGQTNGGNSSNTNTSQQGDLEETNPSKTGSTTPETEQVEEETKEVNIRYDGYSLDKGITYKSDTSIFAKKGETTLTLKFEVEGPEGTLLQYKLVDNDEEEEYVKWTNSENNETFTITSKNSYSNPKTLYVRAYYKDKNSSDPAIIKEYKDNDERISLLFDFDVPKLTLDSKPSNGEAVTNNNVTYKATVTEANDYTLYVQTVDKGQEKPVFSEDNKADWTKAGTKKDASNDTNMQIVKTFSEEGEKDVYFVAVDEAGNSSSIIQARSYLIDKTKPEIGLNIAQTGPSRNFAVSIKARDPESNNTKSGLKLQYNYVLKKGEETVKEGSGDLTIDDSGVGTAILNELKTITADGSHTLTVTVEDNAGNTNDPNSGKTTLTFDQNKPAASIDIDKNEENKDSNGVYHYTTSNLKNARVTIKKEVGIGDLKMINIFLVQSGEGGQTFKYDAGYEVEKEDEKKTVTKHLKEIIGTDVNKIGDGTWKIYAFAEDTAGNTIGNVNGEGDDACLLDTVIVDDTAPKLTVDSEKEDDAFVTNGNVTYTATVDENYNYTLYVQAVNKGENAPVFNISQSAESEWEAVGTNEDADKDENSQLQKTFSEEAEKEVYFVVADDAGNVSEIVQARSYLIDKTKPEIQLNIAQTGPSRSFTVSIEARDPESNGTKSGLKLQYNYVLKKGEETVKEGSGDLTIDDSGVGTAVLNELKTITADGSHTLTVTVEDNAGNTNDPNSGKTTLTFDQNKPGASINIAKNEENKDSNGVYHYTTSNLKNAEVTIKKEMGSGNLKMINIFLVQSGEGGQTFKYDAGYEVEKEDEEKTVTKQLKDIIGTDVDKIGDGTWKIYAFAEDTAGNTIGNVNGEDDGACLLDTVIVDDTVPVLVLAAEEPVSESGTRRVENEEKVYYNGTVTVTAKTKEGTKQADGEKLTWTASNGDITVSADTLSALREFSPFDNVAQALPEVMFTATDLAGNSGSVVFQEEGKEKFYFDLKTPLIQYMGANKNTLDIAESKDKYEYAITIDDGEISCGIVPGSIQYAIVNSDDNAETPANSDWVDAGAIEESGVYSFTVTAPKKGRVFIRAYDQLGNGPTVETANILVMEKDNPEITSITVTADDNVEEKTFTGSDLTGTMAMENPAKGFSVSVKAKDNPDTAFSGLKSIYYKLVGTDNPYSGDRKVEFMENAPEKLSDLRAEETVSSQMLADFFGTPENGHYQLSIQVTDYCGNTSELRTIALEYDNSKPEISVTIADSALEKYPTYHKADNCSVTVSIKEKNLNEYSLSIGSVDIDKATAEANHYLAVDGDTDTTTIKIPADVVSKNTDGPVIISISATDSANNSENSFKNAGWCKYLKKEKDGKASFVLDTTEPSVTEIATNLHSGQEVRQAQTEDLRKYDDLFYFSKKQIDFVYKIEETNYDKELVEVQYSKSAGYSQGEYDITDNNAVNTPKDAFTISLTEEAVYKNINIKGLDKAGNPLTLKDDYVHKTECEEAVTDAGKVTLFYGYVIDYTSPVATIKYTKVGDKKVYAYQESLVANGPEVSAYYSGEISPSITIDETNNADTLTVVSYKSEKLSDLSNSDAKTVQALSFTNGKWAASGLEELSGTCCYAYYTLQGTDRAGNPLVVNESFDEEPENGKNQSIHEKAVSGKNTEGKLYTSLYLMVIDTEAPEIDLTYMSTATPFVYDDKYADGTNDSTDLYAFVSGEVSVKAKISNEDAHRIDPSQLFYKQVDNNNWEPYDDGWLPWGKFEAQTVNSDDNLKKEDFTKAKEDGHYYSYAVYGKDKAGNKATVKEAFESKPDSRLAENSTKKLSKIYKEQDEPYIPLYTIIIDTTVPELTLKYTPVAARKTITTFLYNESNVLRAYLNGDINVDVTLKEEFFDFARLYANQKINETDDGTSDEAHTWKKLVGDDQATLNGLISGKGVNITGAAWDMSEPGFHKASNDSEYTWHVFGTDRAGNAAIVKEVFTDSETGVTRRYIAVKQEENNTNTDEEKTADKVSSEQTNCGEGFTPAFVIVIDKTAPAVTSIETINLSKNGDADKTSKPNYYSDDETYYYNPANGMQTVFTCRELNYDSALFYGKRIFNGADDEFENSKKEDSGEKKDIHTYTMIFTKDGLYKNICLFGRDKAGNHVVLDGSIPYTMGYDPNKKEHAVSEQNAAMSNIGSASIDSYGLADTSVTLCHSRILDRVKPVATIKHTIPKNTTGYVYGDVEDKVGNKASIYANSVLSTSVTVSDKYGNNTARLDGEKLTVKQAFHLPEKEGKDYKYSAIESWNRDNEPGKLSVKVKTDTEGHYAFSIVGTDRAGNPVTVNEVLDRSQTGAKVNTKKGGYDGTLSVAASDENTFGSKSYRSLFVLVYDATAPVYRLNINLPKGQNIKDVFDNSEGKHIVYYGKTSTEVKAKYVVDDHHIDTSRIHSATTSMGAKKGSERVDDLDNNKEMSPSWIDAKNEGTLSKDKRKETFVEKVLVDENHEGVYRFEIAGCDKAGNLLVPNGEQKKVDSSNILKDLAARSVEHGSGKGQYWTERKVIDVTAPNGRLTIRPQGDSGNKDEPYVFSFGADGYNTERYKDPFWKSTSAYVIVESDDQSPTFISYDLRSQDKDKDSAYKKKNSVISQGTDGFINDNSTKTSVTGEQVFYIEHLVMKDRAGNMRRLNSKDTYTMERSNNIYMDKTLPTVSKLTDAESPKIKIVASNSVTRHEADGERYIYNPKDNDMSFNVTITDPGGAERSSGLKEVKVVVTAGSEDITKTIKVSGSNFSGSSGTPYTYKGGAEGAKTNKNNLVYTINGTISIPTGGKSESNDIKIEVTAWDNSGNYSTPSKDGGMLKLGIDTTPPQVEVNYHDAATPQNAKYFAGNRTVDIVVIDRNVDNGKVNIQTNVSVPGSFTAPHGNKATDGSGEVGNSDRWTKTLVYDQDGDYTLQISGSDALGNRIDTSKIKWNGPAPNEFTVDKTKPVIDINLSSEANALDQNGILYYNKDVTAQITITEHNFQASDANVDLPVDNKRDPKPGQVSHSGFSTGGDTHNAYVTYDEDGDYTITVKYTDMAGNVAEEKVQSTFVVDKTKPTLELERTTFRVDGQGNPLKDLKDQIYTEKNFAPLVHVDDTNYDANPALSKYEVSGAKNGSNPKTASYSIVNESQFGFDIKFDNFKVEKIADDVYSVKAIAYDKAGNFSELEFRFSVNRFGSTYEYADSEEYTSRFTEKYIGRYYNNSTEEPIIIREINPVSLKTQKVELTKDNNKRTLVKDTDYKVTEDKGSRDGSRMYLYIIDPSVFTEEGVYDFIISSEDVAGNRNSTSQEVKQDGNKEKQVVDKFFIGFQVDKTVPTNRITGVKSDQTRFSQKSLSVYIYPEDAQTAVSNVRLKYAFADSDSNTGRQNAATAYKETLYRYFDEDETPGMDEEDLETFINEDGSIEIPITLDEESKWQLLEIITTDLAGNESVDYRSANTELNLPDSRRSFLITTNPVIQYYNNKPLFYGSLGLVGLLFLLFLFWKRRKEEEGDEEAA